MATIHTINTKCRHKRPIVEHIFLSCFHVGSAGFHEKRWREEREKILEKDPRYANVWILGDEIDGISTKDSRFELGGIADRYHCNDFMNLQINDFVDLVEPIQPYLRGILDSNHTRRFRKDSSFNPTAEIASSLDVPYLGTTVIITHNIHPLASDRVWSERLFLMHGDPTGARTLTGRVNFMRRASSAFQPTIVAMAHVHERGAIAETEVLLLPNAAGTDFKEIERTVHYVIAGSYLRTYMVTEGSNAGYGEVRHYAPSTMGGVSVEMDVFNRDIWERSRL